jgi:hypothetical protein
MQKAVDRHLLDELDKKEKELMSELPKDFEELTLIEKNNYLY